MNNFGITFDEYVDKPDKCIELLSSYLTQGCLGLILGAGASKALELPDWKSLVKNCSEVILKDVKVEDSTSNSELKRISSKIKLKSGDGYLDLIKQELYRNVNFDFNLAQKELLIAITSLMVGKIRGNVSHIITYNFDSVLEWYLQINGLKVKVSSPTNLLKRYADIEISHIHGYLPHNAYLGDNSPGIVFSKEEFEDRETIHSYWRVIMDEFYRHNIFLTIGVSPQSIDDDICRYLRNLEHWYTQEKLTRDLPYGVAFITSYKDIDEDEVKAKMIKHGIIPCTIPKEEIPNAVFKIAQVALLGDLT